MTEILEVLIRHGYWVVFGAALLEQMGLPLPALPILLAVGALSRAGNFSLAHAIVVAVLGSLAADLAWFALGRSRGHSMLGWVCRLSRTPDSCVQRTESLFRKHGSPILLVAKFLPGFSATSVPLAGMLQMRLACFLFFDGVGAALWAGSYITAGYLFSAQLAGAFEVVSRVGIGLAFWIVLIVATLLTWKYRQRRQFSSLQNTDTLKTKNFS